MFEVANLKLERRTVGNEETLKDKGAGIVVVRNRNTTYQRYATPAASERSTAIHRQVPCYLVDSQDLWESGLR